MLMQVDPRTLGLNLWLIIAAVIVLGIAFVLLIAAWTGVKVGIWQLRRKRADRQNYHRKYQPDGQPYPPAGRGLCDNCGQIYEQVYHLPSGGRRCPRCYAQFMKEPR